MMDRQDQQDPASLSESGGHAAHRFRATLAQLDALALAALLRELGAVLYNRDILRWRVLTDISDELIDVATLAARARLTDRAIASPRKPRAALAVRARRK